MQISCFPAKISVLTDFGASGSVIGRPCAGGGLFRPKSRGDATPAYTADLKPRAGRPAPLRLIFALPTPKFRVFRAFRSFSPAFSPFQPPFASIRVHLRSKFPFSSPFVPFVSFVVRPLIFGCFPPIFRVFRAFRSFQPVFPVSSPAASHFQPEKVILEAFLTIFSPRSAPPTPPDRQKPVSACPSPHFPQRFCR